MKVIGQPQRAVSLPRALSKLGLCSRKQAVEFIETGRVAVNACVSRDASLRVSLDADRISLDGNPAEASRESIVIAMNKPVAYVTTRTDPQGRRTVYDLLPKLDRFVFPVGRLDKETSGLLILTDDHRLGEALTNPGSHVPKTYEVVVDRVPDEAALQSLRCGLDIGRGERTRPARIDLVARILGEHRIRITIHEGKNRQIRRMMGAVGLSVLSLTRTAVGALALEGLAPGAIRVLSAVERQRLLRVASSRR